MKKILLVIAIIMTLGFGASAQGNMDAFINEWGNGVRGESIDPAIIIALPGWNIGSTENATTPLGSGLFILGALGAGYAVARRNKRKE